MTERRVYQTIAPVSSEEAEAALEAQSPNLHLVAVAVGLYESDLEWGQSFLLRLTSHQDPLVRGNAILGLGHLARVHGSIDLARVMPVVTAAASDPEAWVRGHANSVLDDLEMFD